MFSLTHPILPPNLELSEVLKILAEFSKPFIDILSSISEYFFLTSSLEFALKSISDSKKLFTSVLFEKFTNLSFNFFFEKFANPRNAASGSLRQKNPNETKKIPLKFIAYTFGYEKGLKAENQSNFINKLSEWGFKTNPLNKLTIGIKNLIENYNEIEKKRANLDFDIDGIVYKVNDFAMQKRLGNVANAPTAVSYTHLTLPTNREV